MGTKNRPGLYDCYAAAHPDEPIFVLLGRDPDAPQLVEEWADKRAQRGESEGKITEARECAVAMRAWRQRCQPRMLSCICYAATPQGPCEAHSEILSPYLEFWVASFWSGASGAAGIGVVMVDGTSRREEISEYVGSDIRQLHLRAVHQAIQMSNRVGTTIIYSTNEQPFHLLLGEKSLNDELESMSLDYGWDLRFVKLDGGAEFAVAYELAKAAAIKRSSCANRITRW